MPIEQVKKYAKQIFNGLSNMHSQEIYHRDLKPENILIKDGQIKVCDFGASKELDDMNTPYIVSRWYRAPELILGCKKYNNSIDVWATGCIIFELLTNVVLFEAE